MNRTKIEYLDFTWNPIVGCSGLHCAVHEAGVCWAQKQAKRMKGKCEDCYTFKPHMHYERLKQPLQRKKPSRIGVAFMGDLFDASVNIIWTQRIFNVMTEAEQHTFLVLTKQAQNMVTFSEHWFLFPDNVWAGVTVNRTCEIDRIEALRKVDARVKFVSFEPLLEHLGDVDLEGINWIIIGAQTRPTILPDTYWVWSLRNEADRHGIPIFMKNKLRYADCRQEFPKGVSS